jgi:rhomboid protease GluP
MCGRELPGASGEVCADCRAMVSANTVATNPYPQSRPPAPVAVARRRPPVTTALVGLNALVFVAMALTGVSPLLPNTAQLLRWGANFGPLSLNGEPWRMLTSNYVHIGIVHIALNMWCLWNLGYLAERIFDPWSYVLTYTACGIAGSVASLWIHPLGVGAGASGAIFGMAGALIAALYLGRLPVPKSALKGTMKSLLTFAGYNLFFGAVAPGIDNSAHIGGLVIGLAIGAVLAQHLTAPPDVKNQWRRYVFIAVVLILLAAGAYVKKKNGRVTPPSDESELMNRWPRTLTYSSESLSGSASLTTSTARPRTE